MRVERLLAAPIFAAAILLSAGCAPRQAGRAQASVEAARVAVSEAERNEAPQFAASDYQRAQDKFLKAQEELRQRDYQDARRFGEQATVDARVAAVRAQAEHAETQLISNRETRRTIQESR